RGGVGRGRRRGGGRVLRRGRAGGGLDHCRRVPAAVGEAWPAVGEDDRLDRRLPAERVARAGRGLQRAGGQVGEEPLPARGLHQLTVTGLLQRLVRIVPAGEQHLLVHLVGS